MSASAARRIAGYEVERELGQGGMGTLYLATQPILERPAVLKALRHDWVGDARQEERFRREAQSAARIHHPNVVAVYDCFAFRGELYLAQEYVEGLDLASLLARCGPLPARSAARIALEVARGLEEIHAQGIVHRDLKPANVLLSRRGEVKIADFGIALPDQAPALTRIGCAVGTAPYMAPEQLLGDRVDERSDSFAFGLLLYELLTGARPFAGEDSESEAALLRSIQSGRYPAARRRAPGTPRWLARVIRDCLRAKPQRRPPARDLRRELERCVSDPEAAACRSELAAWLEQSGALEAAAGADPGATRVKAAVLPARPRRRWLPAAAAALLLATALAGVLRIRARPAGLAPLRSLPALPWLGRAAPAAPPAAPAKAEGRPRPEPPAAAENRAERADRAEKRAVQRAAPEKSARRPVPAPAAEKTEKRSPAAAPARSSNRTRKPGTSRTHKH